MTSRPILILHLLNYMRSGSSLFLYSQLASVIATLRTYPVIQN
jgi:hypothetical protein